jgi:hypothetical protein
VGRKQQYVLDTVTSTSSLDKVTTKRGVIGVACVTGLDYNTGIVEYRRVSDCSNLKGYFIS